MSHLRAERSTQGTHSSIEAGTCVMPPRPGVLEAHGYDDLLGSFAAEMKKKPDDATLAHITQIIKDSMAREATLVASAAACPATLQRLVNTGYILPAAVPKLMSITPEQITRIPDAKEIEMRKRGFLYLQALTHPAILQARILVHEKGYNPPLGKKIKLFERLIRKQIACTYEDFGLQPVEELPHDEVQESSTKILAQGCFSWLSRNHVGFPTTSNSMNCTNSAEALATLALSGTFACIPTDGHLASLESRIDLAQYTQELLRNHPVVKHHKHKNHILSNGKSVQEELQSRTDFLVATLKQNPDRVVREARALYDAGIRTFRVYDAGSTRQLSEAVKLIREHLPDDVTLLVGQVVGKKQGRSLVELGADALIVGIGEGGICTTPVVGGLAPNNIMVAYRLCRAGLGVPIICDGGVGRAAAVIFAMGASAAMASRRIIGGTCEQIPSAQWVKRNGHYEKPYYGEASAVTKILGGNTTMAGDPYNLEGISSFVQLDDQYPTVAARYVANLAGLCKTIRFSRAHSLQDLIERRVKKKHILQLSDGARAAAGAHHVQKEVVLNLYGFEER